VIKIKSPILKGLSSKKREDFSASLQQDLTTWVQKKYLISVGLILKNMHMQRISRPFLRRVNGKKFKLKE